MKSKKWYQHDRYVASMMGSGITAIASIVAMAWSIWRLGLDKGAELEADYVSELMHNELGDDWEKHRININNEIDKTFEKAINK